MILIQVAWEPIGRSPWPVQSVILSDTRAQVTPSKGQMEPRQGVSQHSAPNKGVQPATPAASCFVLRFKAKNLEHKENKNHRGWNKKSIRNPTTPTWPLFPFWSVDKVLVFFLGIDVKILSLHFRKKTNRNCLQPLLGNKVWTFPHVNKYCFKVSFLKYATVKKRTQ